MKPGRNDQCPCGSGKKYKKCCQEKPGGNPSAPASIKAAPPTAAECNQLVTLLNAGHYVELEKLAYPWVEQYPESGFVWKVLGAALQAQGKDELPAKQKAAEFLPDDADAHYNLGNTLNNLGQYENAVTSYRRALEIKPDYAEAHNNLGNALKNLGQLEDAAASYRRALEIKPDYTDAHGNLGIALNDLGQLEDAAASYRRALEIKPDYAATLYNMGNALQGLGQLEDAAMSYRRALEVKPDYAEAHNNLGNAMRDIGQLDAAVASYNRALESKPDYAAAHNNLGIALNDLGQLDAAVASYRRALEIKPDYAEAHINLGNALNNLGQLEDAVASYHRALEIKPDCAEAHNNLGNVLKDFGQLEDAVASYRRALKIKPDYAEAHNNLGNFLRDIGHLEDAAASYRRALEFKHDYIEARLNLALGGKVKVGDENLAALAGLAESARAKAAPLPAKDAVSLHFALGKCYDDIGDHEKAFPHFIEGCCLKRATFDYDPNQTAQYFASIMRNFDAPLMGRLRGGGDPSSLPIFVLGMPRSGTTLTEQIIASHPQVHGAGELSDMMEIVQRDIGDGSVFPNNLHSLDQGRLAAMGAEYVARLQRRAPGVRHITDKMPGNFLAVGLIHLMLPNTRIIHVNRNPVDTCLSCFTQLFTFGHDYTYDLAELGRYYADYFHLMQHWRRVLPKGAFLDVQYEDIVADKEGQARRIIEYCGLEWDDACLDFHKTKRAVHTASAVQVRQPMYQSSVERWRKYERFLGPLLDALGDLAPQRG